MGGIYQRGNKLWLWFFDADGIRVFNPTTARVGEEARARRMLEIIERRIEAEKHIGIPAGELTVKAYGERWIKGRPAQGVATADDEARRLRLHAWPLLGDVLVKDLRPHHVRDMVRALRGKKSARGTLLAPRSVRHVYGTLHTMLHDAVVDELLAANPCVLKKGELPPKVDKDPEWRSGAVFTREEAEQLLSDERIPEDRRMWHGLLLLAGLRFGEAAALRWRHYDATTSPLGRLNVASNWDADNDTETSTKTEKPRAVPVHSTLAKLLAAWKLGGYERVFGHSPGAEDLILPGRNGEHRNPRRALLRFHEDLRTLGLRSRRQHDCRRTFTSLALADGARKDVLRWVTHGPEGDIVSLYSTLPWESLCAEVARLRLELREGRVLEFRRVAAAACDSTCDSETGPTKKPPSLASLGALRTARSTGLEPVTSGVTGGSPVRPGGSSESQAFGRIGGGEAGTVQSSRPLAGVRTQFGPPVVQGRRAPLLVALDGGAGRLLNVREVAERLGVRPVTVYNLCAAGALPHVRVSNAIRVAPADLAAFVERSRR